MIQTTSFLGAAVVVVLCAVEANSALAQTTGCSLRPAVSAQRQTLNCEPGLIITIERGASYQLSDRNRDGRVDAIVLNSRAALVDVDSARIRGGFEVVTPQAIAAVRGTRWAVDAQRGKTSVLVLRGRVAVNKISTGEGVTLRQGQGVDVDRGRSPLRVTSWGQARINALMGRLGQ
ncbi:FecR domain-containing protein [Rhizobium calliandrae]|uniref:FecR domain-containing protein n=1 Tax=Rhizobium calliandrae TaxID=1312182 RepID=A0ABT7KFF1_9HYPH|nr:FecR domain-containing protein [Rhizobium calliandrae]MDL2407339.1 FecR domain-containing protein [Rhizobium calliandrae]